MGKGTLICYISLINRFLILVVDLNLKIAAVTGNGTLALHAEPAGFYLKVGRAWPVEQQGKYQFWPAEC